MIHENPTLRSRVRILWSTRNVTRISLATILIATLFVVVLPALRTTRASNPASGTITPASTPLAWTGTGVGGGSLNAPLVLGGEDACQEGVSCDTFTLNVGGTTSDWSGKLIHVKI